MRGRLAFGAVSADSAFGWRAPDAASDRFGRSAVDFTPLFGDGVAPDGSTSVVGPVDTGLVSEAAGGARGRDSLEVELIPRVSHGGISMRGHVRGDSAWGVWEQRAYCCGAVGRFRMRRTDRTPPRLALPPRPAPPPPLDTTRLGKVRVRVWDAGSGRYVRMGHALRLPGNVWRSEYHTGVGAEGWGTAFWVEPGEYAVEFTRFPCGAEEWFLKAPIRRTFMVAVGGTASVTVATNLRRVEAATSYNNPSGRPCRP